MSEMTPPSPPTPASPPPPPPPPSPLSGMTGSAGAPAGERRGKRPWAASEVVSWVVIVGAVVVMVWAVMQSRGAGGGRAEGGAGGGGGEIQKELLLSGRYAVGLKELLQRLGGGAAASRSAVGELVEGLEQQAKGPENELRAAMVRAEVEGVEAARARLERLGRVSPELEEDVGTLERLYAGEAVEGAAWERFAGRHGWFAELAATRGKTMADAQRAGVVYAGYWTMGVLIVVVLGIVGMSLLGLVLLVVAVVLLWRKKLKPAFDRVVLLPRDRRAYVQGFALFIGCLVGGNLLVKAGAQGGLLNGSASLVLGILVMLLAFVSGVVWPIFAGQGWAEWRATVGLHRGRGIVREMAAGMAGYIAGFPLLIAGAAMTFLLIRLTGSDATHPIMRQLESGPLIWLGIFVLATVWAPVTEELMFRGMLLGHLRERWGWWVSAPIVGLIFALIHPQGWAAAPVLTSLAVVFAGIREWRGSVIGCITAHGVHNGAALLVATAIYT